MKDIVLLGMGGHAKVVVDTIEQAGEYHIMGFLDKPGTAGESCRGYRVIGNDEKAYELYQQGYHEAFVSLGYLGKGAVRNRLYEGLVDIGYHLPVILDHTAATASDIVLGDGTYVGKNAVINANALIGKMCIINTGAVVEHDCVIGDFTHVSINAAVCGGCTVGHDSFIGAGSVIIQGVHVGSHVTIGAGTVVLRDVPDGTKAIGVYKGEK